MIAELAPLDTFRPLDTFAGGLADEPPRLDALATISAGERGEPRQQDGKTLPGLPRRSTDGTIKLHDATGRGPGLRAALERTQYRSLTVAFPWDDPALFVQQRFVRYSATALEVYGDHRELRVLEGRGQRTVPAADPEYRGLLDTCAVSVSVYFMLAEWEPHPAVVLPDGLGFYRLRFTSRNSLRSILSGLRAVGRFTGGRIAGVPFELRIDYRETTDRTQKRRTIPVWVLVMRPPSTVRLASHNWAGVVRTALAQGEAFKELPPPGEETLALAAWEGPDEDLDAAGLPAPTDAEIAQLAEGGPLDADYWRRRWHAIAAGTRFEDDEERAEFIADFTEGRYASLKRFLEDATDGDCEALIAELQGAVIGERGAPAADAPPVDYLEVDEDAPVDADDQGPRGDASPREPDQPPSAAEPHSADLSKPPKRHGQKALNAFFAQIGPLRPRPTPADIHRILGVAHIQEVADLDLALQAIFEAWRREHPPAAAAASPFGDVETEWERYTAAQRAAATWNRDYPEQAIRFADPPRDATAAQVRAYAEGLEKRLAKLAGGGA